MNRRETQPTATLENIYGGPNEQTEAIPTAAVQASPGAIKALWITFALIVALGAFLRFYNLDRRVFWIDEAYTTLAVSGHTVAEVVHEVETGRIMRPADLHKFEVPSASVSGTIRNQVESGCQHPPLFYLLERLWAEVFGASSASMRTMPALFSLLMLPAIFLLCLELFQSRLTAAVAVATVALSPYQLSYAQDAREYTMWALLSLCSSIMLLRALKSDRKSWWVAYTGLTVTSLYTYPFTFLIAAAQIVFVFATRNRQIKLRADRPVKALFVCLLIAMTLYSPWIMAFLVRRQNTAEGLAWTAEKLSPYWLCEFWRANLASPYFDMIEIAHARLFQALVCAMIVIGLSIFLRHAPKRARIFISALALCSLLPLLIPDIVFGGRRSTVSRYLTSVILSTQLAVAFSLAYCVRANAAWMRRLGFALLAAVLIVETGSCLINSTRISRLQFSYRGERLERIASVVNSTGRPLIYCNTALLPGQILALNRMLKPEARFAAFAFAHARVPEGFENAVLFDVRPELGLRRPKHYNAEAINFPAIPGASELYRKPYLWSLSPRPQSQSKRLPGDLSPTLPAAL